MTAVMPGQGYIRGFDGLRAIAVLLVISIHLGAYNGRYSGYAYFADGVAIFFVISGFLITGILLNDQHRSILRFFARRMLRLYPALLLYVAGLTVFARMGWATVPAGATVTALTYTSNYAPFTSSARETSHLWSLGVEEQFYLVWPMVIFYMRRLAPLLAIAGIGAAWWLRVYPPIDKAHYVDRYFIPAADSILIGCLAALIICPRFRTSTTVQRLTSAPETLFVAIICFVAPKWLLLPYLSERQQVFVNLEIQRVGVALLVLWICTNQASGLVRRLEWRPLRYLGRISYGVYLWQGLFVRNGAADPAGWFQRWPYNFILAICVAALSYELVERRFLRLKNRMSAGRADDDDPRRTSTTGTRVRPVYARTAAAAAAAVKPTVATAATGTGSVAAA